MRVAGQRGQIARPECASVRLFTRCYAAAHEPLKEGCSKNVLLSTPHFANARVRFGLPVESEKCARLGTNLSLPRAPHVAGTSCVRLRCSIDIVAHAFLRADSRRVPPPVWPPPD
jgi:hypothetical protein